MDFHEEYISIHDMVSYIPIPDWFCYGDAVFKTLPRCAISSWNKLHTMDDSNGSGCWHIQIYVQC